MSENEYLSAMLGLLLPRGFCDYEERRVVFRLSCNGYRALFVEVEVMLWTFRGDDVVVCSSGEAHQSPDRQRRERGELDCLA